MKPAKEVLVHTGPHVVQAGHAVGGGRTLVKDPLRCAFPLLHGAFEDAMRSPAGQFGLLECDEISIGGDRCEHAPSVVVARAPAPVA
jgi:hypothetical protein